MRNIVGLYMFCFSFLFSCQGTDKESQINALNAEMSFTRMDEILNKVSTIAELDSLKNIYPLFFPNSIDGVQMLDWLNSEESNYIQEQVDSIYHKNDGQLEREFQYLSNHLQYYFPHAPKNRYYTILGNGDYEDRILINKENVVISIDFFLGRNSPLYLGLDGYLKSNFEPKSMLIQVAKELVVQRYLNQENLSRVFVYQLIQAAKPYYASSLLVPGHDLGDYLGFTSDQFDWARANEYGVWAYFIEQELLFSSSSDLKKRFIDLAPFSKFYMSFDRESPGQIGIYMGYKILDSYMQNNDVSLAKLLTLNPQVIYENSKFKPNK